MGRRSAALAVGFALAAYFGLLVLPEWRPAVLASGLYLVYLLTLPVTLLALVGCGFWGAAGLWLARHRGSTPQPRHRAMLTLSIVGVMLFGGFYGLSAAIRGPLPSGSYLLKFDSARWQEVTSSHSRGGDISARQKMLGDVVSNVLPGRSRQQLEQMLGPSLDTTYFGNTGRDLIYLLGRERGSMFAIDSEWLLIWMDASGRFKEYQIRTD